MNSLIIPVYKNEENIPHLIAALQTLNQQVSNLEIVFVVDGSPDASANLLAELLPSSGLTSQLLLLSRNFGPFSAILTGLKAGHGKYFAVMAADLQEPPELMVTFFKELANEDADVVLGVREFRSDPWFSKLASNLFWRFYKRFIVPEIPVGGVDVFACNLQFRNSLVKLEESNSSLVALIFWMGFRRKMINYTRLPRQHGKSAWTLKKKYNYVKDSIFSFTNAPIKLLSWVGVIGMLISVLLACFVLFSRIVGWIDVPGYAATILTVVFFGALNIFGIGIVGTYTWRAYENTKFRPSSLIMKKSEYGERYNESAAD